MRWVVAEPIDTNDPPRGRFSDDWAEIYMQNGKVGYAHSTMTRDGDLIHTGMTMHMMLGRAGQSVSIHMDQKITETIVGVPKAFSTDIQMSAMKTSTRGTIEDGRVRIVSTQYGMEQTQEFEFPKGALMAWGTFREGLARGFKPGTEYTLDTYAPDLRLDGAVQAVTRVAESEEFTHRGKTHRGQKVMVTMQSPIGSMQMTSWVDENGMPLKALMPLPGMGDITLYTADERTALSDFVPPEFFMASAVKAKQTIDYAKVSRIRYRISARNGEVELGDLPETDSQSILGKGDRWIEIQVVRQSHKPAEVTPDPSRGGKKEQGRIGDDRAEFLETNAMINTADPELIALARKAAGEGGDDSFALADRLRRFVTEYVDDKSLNIGFATASEVARTKEGDCSEHGILLAALGRINKIPSRVVVGLAYVPAFGGQQDIFGYHLWTQFYIDGRWIDVDAALRETVCSPIRISFATSSLKNAGLAELSLPLLTKLGGIEIDVLEIE